jgi:hypothetical protein
MKTTSLVPWIDCPAPGIRTLAGNVSILDKRRKREVRNAGRMPALCVISTTPAADPITAISFSLQ